MLVPLPSAAQPLLVLRRLLRSPFLAVYRASRRRVLLAKKEGSQHRSAKASDHHQAGGKQQQQVSSTSPGLVAVTGWVEPAVEEPEEPAVVLSRR